MYILSISSPYSQTVSRLPSVLVWSLSWQRVQEIIDVARQIEQIPDTEISWFQQSLTPHPAKRFSRASEHFRDFLLGVCFFCF
tara:strand:- start:1954 stop:2202 length:249 start_codon:yes stop_codon:yes gene_type:complete